MGCFGQERTRREHVSCRYLGRRTLVPPRGSHAIAAGRAFQLAFHRLPHARVAFPVPNLALSWDTKALPACSLHRPGLRRLRGDLMFEQFPNLQAA